MIDIGVRDDGRRQRLDAAIAQVRQHDRGHCVAAARPAGSGVVQQAGPGRLHENRLPLPHVQYRYPKATGGGALRLPGRDRRQGRQRGPPAGPAPRQQRPHGRQDGARDTGRAQPTAHGAVRPRQTGDKRLAEGDAPRRHRKHQVASPCERPGQRHAGQRSRHRDDREQRHHDQIDQRCRRCDPVEQQQDKGQQPEQEDDLQTDQQRGRGETSADRRPVKPVTRLPCRPQQQQHGRE